MCVLIVSIPDLCLITYFNLLRILKFRVGKKWKKVYISFIRPLLEYSDSVMGQ